MTTRPAGTPSGLNLTLAKTTLARRAGGTHGGRQPAAVIAGTKAGTFTFKLGDLGKVDLAGLQRGRHAADASSTFPTPTALRPCTNNAGATTSGRRISPAPSRSARTRPRRPSAAAYNAKKDIATGKAKVKSHFGLKATGKVKFVAQEGHATIVKTIKSQAEQEGHRQGARSRA